MKPEFSQASESFKKANPHIFAEGTLGQILLEPHDPAPTKEEIKSEKELQDQIEGHLERANIVVIRQRMDKKTTTAVGTPDLLFALKGQATAFECKAKGKKATPDQVKMMQRMSANGWICRVVDDYDAAIHEIHKIILQLTLDQCP
ncbi:MAG: hypothetical protein C5B54_10210 [Acidobacteria bacterium]|nr:MAG: hypothetical protein C5B54_10210 [Acidobacteriota bacterium]